MGTEENLGLNSAYIMTQQWVQKKTWDSTVAMEENLGLNSGYRRKLGTQQWVKDSKVGTEENLGLSCGLHSDSTVGT